MMKLDLEFIAQRGVSWLGLAFLGSSLAVSGAIGFRWWRFHEEQASLAGRLAVLEQSLKAQTDVRARQAALGQPEAERRDKEHKLVLASLNYGWNQVFGEIEQASIDHLAVLSFTHDQTTRRTTLTVEAADVATVVEYLRMLNGPDSSGRWYIESYKTQGQSPPMTVTAQLVSR